MLSEDGLVRATTLAAGEVLGEPYHLACFSEADLLSAHGEAHVGADDGPIEIASYDPHWHESFVDECERLGGFLPGVPIHHIGSTAVAGMAAKPVVDMIALVGDLERSTIAVAAAGYRLPKRFNMGLVHRRYLCYPTESFRTHHLHLVDRAAELDQCVRFRDALRASPKLAAEYAALKRNLAARFQADRMGYTKAKTSFIESALEHSMATVLGERASAAG
jgi:GrpB-like predicted nucleotidyltransferase (UPF0157 family)